MPVRFAADAMLARLARWLRVLGYDTTLDPDIDDHLLVEQSAAEGRVLLTRDRHLVEHLKPAAVLLIVDDQPLQQLRQVVGAMDLEIGGPLFTRCLSCNLEFRPAAPDEVRRLVPDDIRRSDQVVSFCTDCDKAYWEGSHVVRMRAVLDRTFPGDSSR